MRIDGWTLLFHDALIGQLERLAEACERARKSDPKNFPSNANVKFLAAIAKVMFEVVPVDPSRPEYHQGNTLGEEYRHWFRVKFLGRFRLFFRYDSRARLIVYAWVDDVRTLRKAGDKGDPYEVFKRMLKVGDPPNDWVALVRKVKSLPGELSSSLSTTPKR